MNQDLLQPHSRYRAL